MNTEITLPVPELKQALPGLNKLIGKRTTLPVLSHVRVHRQNGVVTMQGTDLDAFATYTFKQRQAGEPVAVLVPFEQLLKAFKCSGSKDDVALLVKGENTRLQYRIGKSAIQQSINTLPLKEWPACPNIAVEATPLPPNFGSTLKQAMTCCSHDSTRPMLRGACLDGSDTKAHYIVATNGRFLFSANSFHFPFKQDIIVPNNKFLNGSGLLDTEPCFIAVQRGKTLNDTTHIQLKTKQWDYVTRAVQGNYPNWKRVIPEIDGAWTVVKLSAPAVEQLLQVIPNLPGQDDLDNVVKLRTDAQSLWLEGRNKEDKEWTKIGVSEVQIKGEAKEIALNRDYLLPALKFGLTELAIHDATTPMLCRNQQKRMVIMPVHLKGPQPSAAPQSTPSVSEPHAPEIKPDAEIKEPNMAKTTTKTETAQPESSLLDLVEQIKSSAKSLVRDLNGLTDKVKQLEKDQRNNERELENARAVLKKLQQVTI